MPPWYLPPCNGSIDAGMGRLFQESAGLLDFVNHWASAARNSSCRTGLARKHPCQRQGRRPGHSA